MIHHKIITLIYHTIELVVVVDLIAWTTYMGKTEGETEGENEVPLQSR